MNRIVLTVATLALTGLLIACSGDDNAETSLADQTSTLTENATEMGTKAVDQLRTEFIETMNDKVDAIDGKLAELTERAENLNPAVKSSVEKPLKIAKDRVAGTRDELTKLSEAPVEQWTEHKPRVEKAFTDLQSSFEKVQGLF